MRPWQRYLLILCCGLAASIVRCDGANAAGATIPAFLAYQARLSDGEGTPVDGRLPVRVFLYDDADAGVAGDLNDPHLLYAEEHPDVSVVKGWLRLSIGEGRALGDFAGMALPLLNLAAAPDLFLTLEIDGERVEPRQRVGFTREVHAAAFAKVADNLDGTPKITTSSFPEDFYADKLQCLNASERLSEWRMPSFAAGLLIGTVPAGRMPTGILLSRLDVSKGTLPPDRLPSVSAQNIQSGQFAAGRLPAGVLLAPGELRTFGGVVYDGGSIAHQGTLSDCRCMVSLHSTTWGGAEGMNTVDVNVDQATGQVTCKMSFEEGAWVRKSDATCSSYPLPPLSDISFDPNTRCAEVCAARCGGSVCSPWSPQTPECECYNACHAECYGCYFEGHKNLPCNASYLCACMP